MASQTDERLDALFEQLASPRASVDPALSENAIWQIWLESHDRVVDQRMAGGMRAMSRGELGRALAHFDAVWDAMTLENQARLVRAVVQRVVVDERNGKVTAELVELAVTDIDRRPAAEATA